MKRFKAAVMGGSGYGGAELIRRLLLHPDVELVRVASVDFVGERLSDAHPTLEGATDLRFEKLPAEEVARGVDVVLLGLPHRVSAIEAPKLVATGVRIVDRAGGQPPHVQTPLTPARPRDRRDARRRGCAQLRASFRARVGSARARHLRDVVRARARIDRARSHSLALRRGLPRRTLRARSGE